MCYENTAASGFKKEKKRPEALSTSDRQSYLTHLQFIKSGGAQFYDNMN